ncbi:hypothetical protein GS399_01600 [Pedobacter sp. HMF7647]|uniref:Phage holin family protein n=1 Tax=Hufsiella arboris TaxID=2695275 RepID=A0A7K1Y5J7_9SPHI|nr:phage holin family protein [Hufsiella arboris]MXV49651.1 hypothetical protein [Hufsiella arboris]
MPEITENNQDIISLLKEYVETNIELGKLTIKEKLIIAIANAITDTAMVISLLITFLFACITLGFYLGEVLNSNAAGFGIVSLIFLTIAIIVYFIKDGILERGLHNFMVKRIYRKKK